MKHLIMTIHSTCRRAKRYFSGSIALLCRGGKDTARGVLLPAVILMSGFVYAQPNCNVYKLNKDEPCYRACIIATEHHYSQGSRESQLKFDSAQALCPTFDYAYREKSVPYLKRGDFATWKKLIDKAVELNPLLHMGARGWCKYQFLRDYKGAIEDFDKLAWLTKHDIGYSVNGDYHLNVAKALCYKALGDPKKAIAIIEEQLSREGYSPMPYDYLHLGVLKFETGDNTGGIEYLKKSIAYNDYLAEAYYYLGLIYKRQKSNKQYRENMIKARELYLKGHKRVDPYTHPMDKIYLSDIERELKTTE
jgi:tetratricopeptide (TPR) repeat protein